MRGLSFGEALGERGQGAAANKKISKAQKEREAMINSLSSQSSNGFENHTGRRDLYNSCLDSIFSSLLGAKKKSRKILHIFMATCTYALWLFCSPRVRTVSYSLSLWRKMLM